MYILIDIYSLSYIPNIITTQYITYSVRRTFYTVQYIYSALYSVQCTCILSNPLYIYIECIQCFGTIYFVLRNLYFLAMYTLYIIAQIGRHCTVYSVQYKMYNVRCNRSVYST